MSAIPYARFKDSKSTPHSSKIRRLLFANIFANELNITWEYMTALSGMTPYYDVNSMILGIKGQHLLA